MVLQEDPPHQSWPAPPHLLTAPLPDGPSWGHSTSHQPDMPWEHSSSGPVSSHNLLPEQYRTSVDAVMSTSLPTPTSTPASPDPFEQLPSPLPGSSTPSPAVVSPWYPSSPSSPRRPSDVRLLESALGMLPLQDPPLAADYCYRITLRLFRRETEFPVADCFPTVEDCQDYYFFMPVPVFSLALFSFRTAKFRCP